MRQSSIAVLLRFNCILGGRVNGIWFIGINWDSLLLQILQCLEIIIEKRWSWIASGRLTRSTLTSDHIKEQSGSAGLKLWALSRPLATEEVLSTVRWMWVKSGRVFVAFDCYFTNIGCCWSFCGCVFRWLSGRRSNSPTFVNLKEYFH